MVNKFLYPNGGSETYIFKIGEYLKNHGYEVQFFGMDSKDNIVGNDVESYTSNMDFHKGNPLSKISYSVKTIYSSEAREKIRKVLDDFRPDVVHLNNFNYQLTPSIILEIGKWKKENHCECMIVYTAHDYNLICPNHMLNDPNTNQNCEKCLGGKFISCFQNRCIHKSMAKSLIGSLEGYFWKANGAYGDIDTIICPSRFMKEKIDSNPLLKEKTIVMHNFVDQTAKEYQKKDYVLYFGRFSEEKGIRALLKVCKKLKDIRFVFAGSGPLKDELRGIDNVTDVGFVSGEDLERLIGEARFSVYPSMWYENCPFSVMESQIYQTPVLVSDIGGIPELVRVNETGELFEAGNVEDMKEKIGSLWNDRERNDRYIRNCRETDFDTIEEYCKKLMDVYSGDKETKKR